ncbi:MAG TPA: hypothetical protein VFW96_10970 [Thermomicrobiales bacterium]|nr:hypothetical protein [Thermomicrobiales bacterium]
MNLQTFMQLVAELDALDPPEARQFLLDVVLRPAGLVPGQYNVDVFAETARGYLERLRDANIPGADIDDAETTLDSFMDEQPAAPATGGVS